MVMEYMEHELKALLETMKTPFTLSEVKCLLRQLLDAVASAIQIHLVAAESMCDSEFRTCSKSILNFFLAL